MKEPWDERQGPEARVRSSELGARGLESVRQSVRVGTKGSNKKGQRPSTGDAKRREWERKRGEREVKWEHLRPPV